MIRSMLFARLASHLPTEVVDRVRLLVLALALGFSLLALPGIVLSEQRHRLLTLLTVAVLAWLSWRWLRWYRTGHPLDLDLSVEVAAVVLLTVTSGNLSSALGVLYAGLLYRSFSAEMRSAPRALLSYSLGLVIGGIARKPEVWPFTGEIVVQLPGLALVCVAGWFLSVSLSRQQRQTTELAAAERRYRTLVEQMPVVTFLADAEGELRYISPRVTTLLGYEPNECVGKWPTFLASLVQPGERAKIAGEAWRALTACRPFSTQCVMGGPTGEPVWVRVEVTPLREGTTEEASWLGTFVDESDQERLEQELVQQAFHDPLTALPNRALLLDRLEHALAHLRRRPGNVAVLFLDLDNFKVINDTLGHRTGDQLLEQIARRLVDAVRPSDTVARFGGDEFVILLEDLSDQDAACQIAERLIRQIHTAVDLAGQSIYVTASIGIALTDDPWLHPEELIRRADLAMYEAKRLGRDRYAVFDSILEALAWQRFEIECALRQAIARRELRVDYQPIVDLRSGTLREVEALVRWPHPERGVLRPEEFLPVAEESGLILMVDEFVMEEACHQLRDWKHRYPHCRDLIVSVNLSARHLLEPSLPSSLARVLQRSGLAPGHLRIEISERTVARELAQALDQVRALHSLGVRLALDDFGHGYAAIAALRSLPIDTLKLDRSLIATLGHSPEDTILIEGVIQLAKALGLTVTAEGIETPEHAQQLRVFGCDLGQGTYFGAPMSAEELARCLAGDPLGHPHHWTHPVLLKPPAS